MNVARMQLVDPPQDDNENARDISAAGVLSWDELEVMVVDRLRRFSPWLPEFPD